jgi:hypothetical protein
MRAIRGIHFPSLFFSPLENRVGYDRTRIAAVTSTINLSRTISVNQIVNRCAMINVPPLVGIFTFSATC